MAQTEPSRKPETWDAKRDFPWIAIAVNLLGMVFIAGLSWGVQTQGLRALERRMEAHEGATWHPGLVAIVNDGFRGVAERIARLEMAVDVIREDLRAMKKSGD